MSPSQLLPVILCGGSGTRLWPLWRQAYPKQFLALSGNGVSMSQDTAHRLNGSTPAKLIEVQSGSYLGEDDIVRLEDTCGRAPAATAEG